MNRRSLFALAATGLVAAALAGGAMAQTAAQKAAVDQAKAAGVVGEKNDGYLGFVRGGGDPDLQAAVNAINAGRARLYEQAAQRNNVTPQAAGASAFQQVVQSRLQPGEYYQNASGAWVRK